jgi:hypothetical protein
MASWTGISSPFVLLTRTQKLVKFRAQDWLSVFLYPCPTHREFFNLGNVFQRFVNKLELRCVFGTPSKVPISVQAVQPFMIWLTQCFERITYGSGWAMNKSTFVGPIVGKGRYAT